MAFANRIVCGPVEGKDRYILEHNEQNIVRLMDPDKISKLLIDKGVIDTGDRNQILLPHVAKERNKVLLAKLLMRGPDAFKEYLNALTDSNTDNHAKLAMILRNDNPIPPALPIEGKLQESRQKRINEKIEEHEKRLQNLEDCLNEAKSEDDIDSIRSELDRRNTELEELREKLQSRNEELRESREENKALQKRIRVLENKIQYLETCLKEQKAKFDVVLKQQQQDKRSIKILEEKNAKLESRVDSTEKRMEKKLHDQEKRHNKELLEIKQMIQESAKHSSDGNTKTSSNSKTSPRTAAAGNTRRASIVAKNRFQSNEGAATLAKSTRVATAVQSWKKSTADPDRQPEGTSGKKKK